MALCLWIHGRYVVSSARWVAANNAKQRLSSVTASIVPRLKLGHGLKNESIAGLVTSALRDEDVENSIDWICVDNDWTISDSTISQSAGIAAWKRGQKVVMSTSYGSSRQGASTANGNTNSISGLLQTDAGQSPALAYSLPDEAGHIVFYASPSSLAPDPAIVVNSMPAAGVITFLLMAGLLGIVSFLALMRLKDDSAEKQQNESSHEQSLRRTQALVRTRDTIIFGLAKLAESRDSDTGQHLERISLYSTLLATAMRNVPKFRDDVTPAFVRLIGISSALHDIGKVGIEDAILLKPGRLTVEERKRIQEHTTIGSECLTSMEKRLGTSNFLQMANQIALCHHERWNGMGYPVGIAQDEIPLAARIVAVTDVYDALSIRRVYKEPWPHEKCVELIREQAGQHFDPEIVEVFLGIEQQFCDIARQYADRDVVPVVHQEHESDSVMLKADASNSPGRLDAVIATVDPAPESMKELQEVASA